MDSKKICFELLAAESESAIQDVVDTVPEMRDSANWAAIDDRESNFNIVTNQASTGGKAATELMTNMVDAILMRRAYQEGMDPKEPDEAPHSMYEAVDRLVKNLRGGRLVNADDDWLKDFASKNLVVGITGGKETTRKSAEWPCYTFVDNGEGQHADDFTNTFLSLSARNKADIPFVQGKYNMGSSGVLAYCGTKWFKLIVSRRYDGSGPWGWTLIRRRPGGGMPIADYFHVDNEIASFESNALYPLHRNTGERFDGVMLRTGTVVKLYDFRVGEKFKSFRGAREAFNENLTETILPFRIMDFRWRPDPKRGGLRAQGIDARPFYGMEYILRRREVDDEYGTRGEESHGSSSGIGDKFQVGVLDDPELGRIEVSGVPLPSRDDGADPLPGWLKPQNSNSRVFHVVNGQVQYKQTRGFLSACGYPGLKDRVVIIIDASHLTDGTHFNLWKGDRENIIQNATGEHYLTAIRGMLETSPSLDAWKQEVAREDLERIATEDTNDLFQKLVDSDRDLLSLLDSRDPTLKLPDAKKNEDEFEGKHDPTFLVLSKRMEKGHLELPLNKTRTVIGTTDAANDFFIRADNRGKLLISDESVRRRFRIRHILFNGRLTVFFTSADEGLAPNDSFTFELGLMSDAMAVPVSQSVSIRIVQEEEEKEKKPRPPKPPKPPSEDLRRSLPSYALLTKDGRDVLGQKTSKWPDDFSELDGGLIKSVEDSLIYEINVDNAHHLRYRRRAKSNAARDLLSQKYITGMRLFLLAFENARRSAELSNGEEGRNAKYDDWIDEFRAVAARGAASVVLWLTDQLPRVIDLPDETVE